MRDGVVIPCCFDENCYHSFGDVRETKIHDIWHGTVAEIMRGAHLAGKYNEIKFCSKCFVPHSELDGQVISFESVDRAVKELGKKERVRWVTEENNELSKNTARRLNNVEKKFVHVINR